MKLFRWLTVISVIFIYGKSLTLVAFTRTILSPVECSRVTEVRGLEVLASGWLGLLDGTIGWYANIALVFAIVFLWENLKISVISSTLGLLIALSSLLYKKSWLDENCAPYEIVGGWGMGFYLWLSCFCILLLSAVIIYIVEIKKLHK